MISHRPKGAAVGTSFAIALGLAVACGFLNPAGSTFEEAESRATEGDYVEAIKLYEQVGTEWPDSPEAGRVPDAVDNAFLGWVQQRIETGEYESLPPMWHFVADRDLQSRLPPGAEAANMLGQMMATGPANEGVVSVLIQATTMSLPEKVDGDIARWTCDNKDKFPETQRCLDAGASVSSRAGACNVVKPLADLCSDTKIAEASEDAEAAMTKWVTDERAYIRERMIPVKKLADVCEKTKKDTVRLMERALRSDTQAAIFWMICTRGNRNALNSQSCRDVQDFKLNWSVNFAKLGGLAMRDEYSKECRDHLDRSLLAAMKDCTEKSAQRDTEWLLKLPLEQCPG